MTKTIIEQAMDNCNSKIKEWEDFPTPPEYIKEALRLFAKETELIMYCEPAQRIIEWQEFKKREGI